MNTRSSNGLNKKTENPWNELLSQLTDQDRLENEAQILMFRFLSEIEQHQEAQGMSRKELAHRIGTSASYLTQLWRGHKPLNFLTIAKIQRALGVKFQIDVEENAEQLAFEKGNKTIKDSAPVSHNLNRVRMKSTKATTTP